MAKTPAAQEVEVLRFFETGSLEKVEAVFNIAGEKLRQRREAPAGTQDAESRRTREAARKRANRPEEVASRQTSGVENQTGDGPAAQADP